MNHATNNTLMTAHTNLALAALTTAAALLTTGHAAADDGRAALTDRARYEDMVIDDEVTIEGVQLNDGRTVDLRLRRFDVLAEDATIVVTDADGDQVLSRPDLVLLRGTIDGDESSRVFLGLSPYGTNGFIDTPESTQVISTGRFGGAAAEEFSLQINDLTSLPPTEATAHQCGTPADEVWDAEPLMNLPQPPARVVKFAIETDYEYTADRFGGDALAASAYAVSLMAAVSSIYETELNVSFEVGLVRLWSQDDDPYSGDTGARMTQFQDHWSSSMQSVDRDLTHLLSGHPGGGVANLGVLCTSVGYGLSGVVGEFPSTIQSYEHGNWDLFVVAHELGHNFGAPHTHDYSPQIDSCGSEWTASGTCEQRTGTIMSYCHLCPNGMANIALEFHPQVRQTILTGLAGLSCDYVDGDDGNDDGNDGNDDDGNDDDGGSCGDGQGDCYSPHGGRGCGDSDCCGTVCSMDPFCCDSEWDGQCATIATEFCSGSTNPLRLDIQEMDVTTSTDTHGWLNDIWMSDQQRVIVESLYLPAKHRHATTSIMTAYAPLDDAASLDITIESKVRFENKVKATVYLRNWVTNKWDKIANYTVKKQERVFEKSVGNPSRYIKPGTGKVKIRVMHKSKKTGPQHNFESMFDEVFLTLWP